MAKPIIGTTHFILESRHKDNKYSDILSIIYISPSSRQFSRLLQIDLTNESILGIYNGCESTYKSFYNSFFIENQNNNGIRELSKEGTDRTIIDDGVDIVNSYKEKSSTVKLAIEDMLIHVKSTLNSWTIVEDVQELSPTEILKKIEKYVDEYKGKDPSYDIYYGLTEDVDILISQNKNIFDRPDDVKIKVYKCCHHESAVSIINNLKKDRKYSNQVYLPDINNKFSLIYLAPVRAHKS